MSNLLKKNIIILSSNALKRIKFLIQTKNDPEVIGIKFGIKNRGCNGKSYTLDYLKKGGLIKYDECIMTDGIYIGINKNALLHIIGTSIDYIDTPLSSEFVFNNPNSRGTCGCGESFNI
tara:strand:+ start:182 stop:538 length:357 start_codon:yes stop_codon:yes gene_type:complete